MGSRVFQFVLCNETSIVVHRHSHSIKHGSWSTWLPERVFAGTEATISCSFSRAFSGVCLTLNYGAILNRERYLLHIKLERVGGDDVLSAVFAPEGDGTQSPRSNLDRTDSTCPVIFKVHHEIIDCGSGGRFCKTFRIRVQETADGSLYIKGLKECIEELVQRRDDVSKCQVAEGGIEAFQMYESLPDDFTWSWSTSSWLDRLRKSNRSVLIRIVNLSGKHMKLLLGDGGTTLDDGQWVEYPAEDLPHLCCTEFGVRSTGFFGGTGGRCVYNILGESGALNFSWEQPSIGSMVASGVHSKGKYSIAKHFEPFNEATLTYHIYDVVPPTIDLWAAKAISPGVPSKMLDVMTLPVDPRGYHTFDHITLSPLGTNAKTEQNTATVTNVLHLLLRYHEHGCENTSDSVGPRTESISGTEGDETANVGGSIGTDLFLKSPRHFFNSAILGKRRDMPTISANCLLYLDWGIGNERFCKIFQPDERIHLRSSIPGGINSKKLLFQSRMMYFRCDRPEVFRDAAAASSSARDRRARPFLQSLSQTELMDYVLTIFHSLCEGLQPYVTKRMVNKYGPSWIDEVRVPVGHVWRSEDQVRIDIEGMIYIITAYWMELFEDLFDGNSGTLHIIQVSFALFKPILWQTAAIYWANQELHRFDSDYGECACA
ncbi:hypothetical protein, conserved [Babesia ovata]|uniref:Uncharacterized protein n=1 Tax=Babesia ovata TaxID=189622 RepID=A0A2H6K6F0_9APIC|nr:uncharacterized protein BOVATA_000550 [Babesia ovata]GBE58562.1 hypothetical protein, conserved [Babesia ovata]